MTVYRVASWDTIYENNRSRTVKDLAWVPIPNKHDGERYSRLMLRKDAAQIFAAWILILQVASRCQDRGTLLRSDQTAHDSESLSVKTRAPKAWFDCALPVLVEMKWLTAQVSINGDYASDCRHDGTTPSPTQRRGDEEWNGKNGMEPPKPSALPADPRHHAVTSVWNDLYLTFHGIAYNFTSRDAQALKRLLSSGPFSVEEILDVAREAWAKGRDDRFAKHSKEAATLHGLCDRYNEIRVELQRGTSVRKEPNYREVSA